ncbi:GNAT family N-acetyltransferase [Porticoccaceae bacterium LTM1]|nr:GNAT family N-acetyltransferase [Porticoccaceae bacterium LTM1]
MNDWRCYRAVLGSNAYRASVRLRERILREPQGLTFMPGELQSEVDSMHLVCEKDGRVVACALLKPLNESSVRLRQMAVEESSQGLGVGRELISFAEKLARDAGFAEIVMHARTRAQGFYERLGYHAEGDEFETVGLPHRIMRKQLGNL